MPNSQSDNTPNKQIFDITKVRLVYKQPKSLQDNYFYNGITELKTTRISGIDQNKKGKNNISTKQTTEKKSSKTEVKTKDIKDGKEVSALNENKKQSIANLKDLKNDLTGSTEELIDVNSPDQTIFESSSESSKTQTPGERKKVTKLFHGHNPSDEVHLAEKELLQALNTDEKLNDDDNDIKGKTKPSFPPSIKTKGHFAKKPFLRGNQPHHFQVDHRHRPPPHNSYHQTNPSRQHQEEVQGPPIDQHQQGKEPHHYLHKNRPHPHPPVATTD